MAMKIIWLNLLLLVFMSNKNKTCAEAINKIGESKTESYVRLKTDITARLAVVHKIPPYIEEDFLTPLTINITFRPFSISKMEELNQVVTADVFVELRWTLEELMWNSSEYGGLERISLDASYMWRPSFATLMGQGSTRLLEIPPDTDVYYNGTVVSNYLDYLSFYCEIDFKRFPFDVQNCSIGFLYIERVPPVKFVIDDLSNSSMYQFLTVKGEWSIIKVTHDIVDTGALTFPQYSILLKRQSTYYVITVICPMVMTSVMIPLVFLIPVQTGEKMSYLTAIFTSTAVYLNYISDVMPRSLSSMPHLAVLLIEVMAEGLMATLAALLIVNIYHWEENHSNRKVHPVNETTSPDKCPTLNDGQKELLQDRRKICKSRFLRITSGQLDLVFFFLFSLSQTVILVVMFGFAGWLQDG